MRQSSLCCLVLVLLWGVIPCASADDLITGYVLAEYWDDVDGGSMDDFSISGDADEMVWLESFEIPGARDDDYCTRVSGYLIPPETGDYTFWIASDDSGELWLSPDESYENVVKIAYLDGWANARQWDKDPNQESDPISLVAGQLYYIEADHKEDGGGDNLAVAWAGPGIGDGSTTTVIDGEYLSPYLYGDDDPLIVEYYKVKNVSPEYEGYTDSTDPTLAWGDHLYADHYVLYFSTDYDEVNDATVDGIEVDTTSYSVSDLSVNVTYYWRVDAVSSDDTAYQGDIWSFLVSPKSALNPSPVDGVYFADPNVDLSWAAGMGAVEHILYFGTNADDVAAGANEVYVGTVTDTSYELDTLDEGTTYYWRVDEYDGTETTTGEVWQFQVEYDDIPLAEDANLVAWWKLDEGADRVVDWSGHGFEGTIEGDPECVEAVGGLGLSFSGNDDYIEMEDCNAFDLGIDGAKPRTICGWMYTRTVNADGGSPWSVGNTDKYGDYAIIGRSDDKWQLNH